MLAKLQILLKFFVVRYYVVVRFGSFNANFTFQKEKKKKGLDPENQHLPYVLTSIVKAV